MKKISNILISTPLTILISISLIGAVSSLPEIINQLTRPLVYLLDCLIIFTVFLLLSARLRFQLLRFVAWINKFITSSIGKILLITFIIVWQVLCIWALSGNSLWDWQIIITQLLGDKKAYPDYFSFYPNNLLLLKIYDVIWHIMGCPSERILIFGLNAVNTLVIDLGTLFVWICAKNRFNVRAASVSLWLTILFYALTPWVVVPYSDTWAFLFCTMIVYLLVKMSTEHRFRMLGVYTLLLALIAVFAYFMKPTTVILIIAVGIVTTIKLLGGFTQERKFLNKYLFLVLLFSISSGIGIVGVHNYLYQHNGIVKIKKDMAMPLTHFIAMGIKGQGGFNNDDTGRHLAMKNTQIISLDAIQLIKSRYAGLGGVAGYQKFLIQKQMANTADGTLGWGHEGGFLIVYDKNNKIKNVTIQRKLYVHNGVATTKQGNYRFIQQCIWIFILISIMGSITSQDLFAQYLKYCAVGFFIFLLLFEGGRSRYLIQFLPILLLLSTIGSRRWLALVNFTNSKYH